MGVSQCESACCVLGTDFLTYVFSMNYILEHNLFFKTLIFTGKNTLLMMITRLILKRSGKGFARPGWIPD